MTDLPKSDIVESSDVDSGENLPGPGTSDGNIAENLPEITAPTPEIPDRPSHWTEQGPRRKNESEYSSSPAAIAKRKYRQKKDKVQEPGGQQLKPPVPERHWGDTIPSENAAVGQVAAETYCGFLEAISRGRYAVPEKSRNDLADAMSRWLWVRARAVDRFLPEILLAGSIFAVTDPMFRMMRTQRGPNHALPHHGADAVRQNDPGENAR